MQSNCITLYHSCSSDCCYQLSPTRFIQTNKPLHQGERGFSFANLGLLNQYALALLAVPSFLIYEPFGSSSVICTINTVEEVAYLERRA
jgi:hypothetical protein